MLSKKKRVNKKVFQDIMKRGNTISGSFFIFKYIKQGFPQYAFVAPVKIARTAVKRNSMRRLGYNHLRSIADLGNYAGIFFYKKEALKASKDEIKEDIDFILKRVK